MESRDLKPGFALSQGGVLRCFHEAAEEAARIMVASASMGFELTWRLEQVMGRSLLKALEALL